MGGGASVEIYEGFRDDDAPVTVGTKPKERGLPPSLGGSSPSPAPASRRQGKYGDVEVYKRPEVEGTGTTLAPGGSGSFGDTPMVSRGTTENNAGGKSPKSKARKSKTLKELEAEERGRRRLTSSASSSGSSSSLMSAKTAPASSSSTSQERKAQLEATATAHWFRILAHSRAKTGSDTFTYRCRMCSSENPEAVCRICGSSDNPMRIKWNPRTLKYDNVNSNVSGNNCDDNNGDVKISKRAMKLLGHDSCNLKDRHVDHYSDDENDDENDDEDEVFKSAAAAYAASISNDENTSDMEKRQLAEALLKSLQTYDEAMGITPSDGAVIAGNGDMKKLPDYPDVHRLSEDSLKIGLPDLLIALKSRTTDSITVTWDMDRHAADTLALMINNKNEPAVCRYHALYRIYLDEKDRSGSGLLRNNITKEKKKWTLLCYSTTNREETATGLLPNTKYEFKCRRLGWGGWCKPVIIRSGPGPPSCPQSLVAKEITSNSIIITWTIPEKDNGLPILDYTLYMKSYRQDSELRQVYKGKERLYLVTNLSPNMVYIFTVKANNKAGEGDNSEKYAVRTLPDGAAASTPWVESIDEKSGKLFYSHQKSNAIAWMLPKGALIDELGSFKNKKNWLLNQIERRRNDVKLNMGLQDSHGNLLFHSVKLDIDRDNLMERSLALLHRLASSDMIAGPIRISFVGEEGLDAGGLAKDWYQELMRKVTEGTAGLLKVTQAGVQIDIRASEIHSGDTRWLFRSLGILVAKAIVDNQILGVSFSPLFLSALKGENISLEDLKYSDPEFYNGLKWVEQNDVTSAELTFSVSYEGMLGESITVPLGNYDESERVTEDNKTHYIELMLEWLSKTRFEPCLSHLKDGFYSLMRLDDLKHFRGNEVQMLLGGKAEIDTHELKNTTRYNGGYKSDSPVVLWFWQIVEEADQELMRKLLTFSTGCSFLPTDGLNPPFTIVKSLEGQIAANSINERQSEEPVNGILPTSHTCFNQLVLPPYTSFEVLKERLEYALENAGCGFYMQ